MPPRPVVAAAIVDSLSSPTRLLAAARSYPKSLAGMFELPGGKVDQDEDPRSALIRELDEELGVGVVLGDPVAAPRSVELEMEDKGRSWPYRGPGFAPWPILQGRVMWVWMAEVHSGQEPQLLGSHSSLVWVCPAEALKLPWLPSNVPIVEACIAKM